MEIQFKHIILTLLALIAITKFVPTFVSKSLLSGFEYRVPIDIKYTGTQHNVDGYVLLTINTEDLVNQGKLSYDCSDLRFEIDDSGLEAPYVLLSECPSSDTMIALAVTDLNPQQTIREYMYYKSTVPRSIPNYVLSYGSLKKDTLPVDVSNKPEWNSLSCHSNNRCYFNYRSKFSSSFGNLRITYHGDTIYLDMHPGDRMYSINGLKIWVRTEILDDYTYRVTIIPLEMYSGDAVKVIMDGSLSYRVYDKEETINLYRTTVTYYVTDDKRSFDHSGKPQVRFLVIPGDFDCLSHIHYSSRGRSVSIEARDITLPVQFYITVGDFDESTYKQYIHHIFDETYIPNRIIDPNNVIINVGPEESIASLYDVNVINPTKDAYYYSSLPYNLYYNISIDPPISSNITVYIDNDLVFSDIISNLTYISGTYQIDYYGKHELYVYANSLLLKEVSFYVLKEQTSIDLEAPPIFGADGETVTLYAYSNRPIDSASYYIYSLDGTQVTSGSMTIQSTYATADVSLSQGQYKVRIDLSIDNETYVLWTYANILSQYTISDVIDKIDQLNQTFMSFYFDWQQFRSNTEEYLQQILGNVSEVLSKQDLTLQELYNVYTLLQDVYSAQQQLGIDLQNVNQTLYEQLQQVESNLNDLITQKANEIIARINYLSQQQNLTYDEVVAMRQDLQLLQLMVQNNTDLINQYGTDILNQLSQTNQTLYNLIQLKSQEILNKLDQTEQSLQQLNQTLLDFADQYNIDRTIVLQYLESISEQVNYTRQQVELLQPINDNIQDISYTLDQLYDQLLNHWMPELNNTIITRTEQIKQMLQEMNITDQEIYNQLDQLTQIVLDIQTTVNQTSMTLDDINAQLQTLDTIVNQLSLLSSKINSIYDIVRRTNENTEDILDLLEQMQQQINTMQNDIQSIKNVTVQTSQTTQQGTQSTVPTGTQSILGNLQNNKELLAIIAGIVGLIIIGVTIL